MSPIAVPLHQVSLQHKEVVRLLNDKYLKLGLFKPIDSSYHAATASVKKKELL